MSLLNTVALRFDGYSPDIARCLRLITVLGIRERKEVISACQLGRIPDTHSLIRIIHENECHGSYRRTRGYESAMETIGSLQVVLRSHILRSILWMFCRTVTEPSHNNQAEEVAQSTFLKEFRASQTVQKNSGYIDHSAFYIPVQYWNPHWRALGQRVLTAFENKLRRQSQKIIFPQVQRKKNTSDETALLLQTYKNIDYVRTVDLEVFYHETGMKIQGACECRSAWKFNDLKPRCYYCQGGRDYWASRYMKPLAVALMECIPSTTAAIRRDPTQASLDPQDYIITWDFEAFTTSLSQLKFFLSAITDGLRLRELPNLQVFDYRHGVIEVDPCDLLDEYNEICNINAPFSVHRLVDRYNLESLGIDRLEYHQQNSGMLGVAGNIGFSTACHGMEVCKICGEDKCVCVGDDALGLYPYGPEHAIIPYMQELGTIHPEKFSFLTPLEEGPLKFVKRALYRDVHSLFLDFLVSLPISPYVDGNFGSRTVPPDLSNYKCAKMVAIAVGQVLWDVHSRAYDLDEEDMRHLDTFLSVVYQSMRFPRRGLLPGASIYLSTHDSVQIKFVIPAIDLSAYDPRSEDWLEYLLSHHSQMFFSVPILTEYRTVEIPSEGEEMYVPQQKGWKALEDCGYVTIEPLYEVLLSLSGEGRRRIRWLLKVDRDLNMLQMCRVVCLKEIPDMFHELPMFQNALLSMDYELVHTL